MERFGEALTQSFVDIFSGASLGKAMGSIVAHIQDEIVRDVVRNCVGDLLKTTGNTFTQGGFVTAREQ